MSSDERGRKFTAEFKRDTLELANTTGRSVGEIVQELGIYDSTHAGRRRRLARGAAEAGVAGTPQGSMELCGALEDSRAL